MKQAIPIPNTKQKWLAEVSAAYLDAYETIPFQKMIGPELQEDSLFQLAPLVCLKFRGISKNKKDTKIASDASLCSYVATKEQCPELFETPQVSFAFCYLASHFGLDLISEDELNAIMEYIELNTSLLIGLTNN